MKSSLWIFNATAGNAIPYNNVVTNIGNGLDLKTGIFTAPVNGTFYFTWTGQAFRGAFVYLKSSTVNTHLCGTYSPNTSPSSLKCHAIVSLKKGDTVWTMLYYVADGHNIMEPFMRTSGLVIKPILSSLISLVCFCVEQNSKVHTTLFTIDFMYLRVRKVNIIFYCCFFKTYF